MIEVVGDIAVAAVMALWLLGNGFVAYSIADGDTKLTNRIHAFLLLAWFIVASQLYVF